MRTRENKIPLVTVEQAPNGRPRFNKTPVDNADQASQVARQQAQSGRVVAVEVASLVHADLVGPDPFRSQQWALDQVSYEQAWATGNTKGANVRVGVVDTGSTPTHPDLQGQVLDGHSFLNNGAESSSAIDDNGHGTHVSGIIAAVNNNATGVTGAAPDAKILPVKVLDAKGQGFNSDVASGITWAVDNGAGVVNLSLGGPTNDQATCLAVHYAQQNDRVVVAAGGNTGQNGNAPSYPAALSQSSDGAEPIAVAATTNANPPGHPSYGTIGNYLDIAAPGGLPSSPSCGSSDPAVSVKSTWNDGGYCSIAGTSMATPYVSAAAALLRAAFPNCAASDVRARLLNTATDLGTPDTFGSGEVDPITAIAACP